MRRRCLLAALSLVVAVAASAADKPDLVVVLSIDQFPYDYIRRFAPYFAADGFNRFLKRGASFTNARYPYAATYTGPGHAAIGTGNLPSRSGIIANAWFDRLSGASEYCVNDPRVTPPFSPLNLASDSLGDRLQEKVAGAKVFGVAIKDRAAILMAGRKATAAYWLDAHAGVFTSSSYYHANRKLLGDYNATIPAYVKSHPVWEPSPYIPAADLARLTHDPARLRKYKTSHGGMGVAFPHPIRSADTITYTPFGNGLVLGLARRLIEAEGVGTADGAPDIVYVSLSSPDYLGHDFGPDSLEAADAVVRTDRDLAAFFAFLDQRFGNRYLLALTADHGVQSIPEVARDLGRDAGRVNMRAAGMTLGDPLILHFEEPALYLNWQRIRELKLDGERVKRVLRDEARKLPGVSGAFTNSELMMPNRQPSALEAMVRRSFRADRSGDVLITLKPGYIWDYSGTGTTHGQPVEADQHVPLMIWGAPIKPGTYAEDAAPTDLAATLGTILGVAAGGPESRVLPCLSPR